MDLDESVRGETRRCFPKVADGVVLGLASL
jgi:hypothetical protein